MGTRQHERETGPNVARAPHDRAAIADAIRDQVEHGPYERSHIFGDGTAGEKIADVLATSEPTVQKRLHLDLGSLVSGS